MRYNSAYLLSSPQRTRDVRFIARPPRPDPYQLCLAHLFDHLVGEGDQLRRHFEPERGGGSLLTLSLPDFMAAFGSTLTLFRHGAGVRYRMGVTPTWPGIGEAAMKVILNDLLLFTCLAAFVTGIVIAAATLLI
jgi:hypothetical protein